MPEIKNPEGWWAALDGNWDDLLKFFALAGAPLSDRDFPDSIAGNAVQHPKTYEEMLREAKEKREHRFLVKHLNIAWFAAPDRMETRTWPGFFVLCDLCSEAWVFQEDWSEDE